MSETEIRTRLLQDIATLLHEWQIGHDWKWYGCTERSFSLSLEDSEIPRDTLDSVSLWVSWWYLDAFVDALNHGFSHLDRLSWEEAVRALEGVGDCLKRGVPLGDKRVLIYAPRRKKSSQTLLRPATKPENTAEELLVRASSSSAAQPAELLRAARETVEQKPEELLRAGVPKEKD